MSILSEHSHCLIALFKINPPSILELIPLFLVEFSHPLCSLIIFIKLFSLGKLRKHFLGNYKHTIMTGPCSPAIICALSICRDNYICVEVWLSIHHKPYCHKSSPHMYHYLPQQHNHTKFAQ